MTDTIIAQHAGVTVYERHWKTWHGEEKCGYTLLHKTLGQIAYTSKLPKNMKTFIRSKVKAKIKRKLDRIEVLRSDIKYHGSQIDELNQIQEAL